MQLADVAEPQSHLPVARRNNPQTMTRKAAHALAGALLSLWAGLASGEWRLGLQDQKTAVGHAIYDLHNAVVLICLVIFVAVFGAMFYAIWRHRKSVGHQAALFHENTTVEMIWTVIPFLILLGMAWPATKTLLDQRDDSAPDLTIKATGYQWKWHYDYLQEGVSFYSNLATPRAQIDNREPKGEHYLLEVDRELVVPVRKKVRILTTAADVLHAWYVPALAVKQDAIPGFVRDAWFRAEEPGVYRGQCAELCGKEHAFMPIVVRAVTQREFDQWVAEQKSMQAAVVGDAAAAAEPADGKGTYEQICQACHAAGLAGAPRTGDKAAWAPRIARGEATLMQNALKGIRMMPPKGGNPGLSDQQVRAAVAYMVAQSR
jgi:cytochrome c oxidase subunit 2